MNDKEFLQLSAAIQAYFNNFKMTELQMDLWFDALDDLDYSICHQAIKKLAQTTKYAPTIAAVRESYNSIANGDKPSLEQTLLDLRKMSSKFGRYKTTEGYKWLQANNPTAYRIMKSLGYEAYANNQASYMQPSIAKLHKEIVENDTDVLLLQDKFASDIGKIKHKALTMNSDNWNG